HRVDDFAEWKDVYDDFDAKRKKMGVKDDQVFQAADDATDVTVWHDFESLDSAKSFAKSNELREAMEDAGVTGDPTIWFTERA
ncbi:MAG TPA: hypothetical protein VLL48_10620, partial [Longimicrobiales bacterium]|nr:hypothetical protein [Longimicrobiales bacterium]